MKEIFTYLGYSYFTHFFVHTQLESINEKILAVRCGQVYEEMLDEGIIKYNEKSVIYNIMPNNKIIAVVTNHVTFDHMDYDKQNLEDIFDGIVSTPRDVLMVVKYDGKKYDTSHIKDQKKVQTVAKTLEGLPRLSIENILYTVTVKSID